MPVTLEWHAPLPALIATYQGRLTTAAYRAMRAQQRALLADAPDEVVVLADMREFDGFSDAIEPGDTLLAHPQIVCAVIVLDAEWYDRLARAFLPADEMRRVSFFRDLDAALAHAETRLRGA